MAVFLYQLNRAVHRVTGVFLFDPDTDARAHHPKCGMMGYCDCKATR